MSLLHAIFFAFSLRRHGNILFYYPCAHQVGITLEGLQPHRVELDHAPHVAEEAQPGPSSPGPVVESHDSQLFSPQPSPSAKTRDQKGASVKRQYKAKLKEEMVRKRTTHGFQ
jgi:hypothetical protein